MSEILISYIQDLIDDLELYFIELEDELDCIYDSLSDNDETTLQSEIKQTRDLISTLSKMF